MPEELDPPRLPARGRREQSLSCVANIAPRPCAELYDAFAAGDRECAVELHYELHPLVELAFLETNPGPVKWAMERLGIVPCGDPRAPLTRPAAANQERIEALLAASGLVETASAA